MKTWVFFASLFAALLATRLCHSGILWEPETLPLAAAKQMLMGKMLYRDLWYDKPPLVPAFYLAWGALAGWPLRVAGAAYSWIACACCYLFARDLWSWREGRWAAGLLAFFLIFDFPSAVIPIGADMLMLVPHILAVYFAWGRRPLLSGIAAGLAFLCNAKAVFVLFACLLFCIPLAFILPLACAAAVLWLQGAWNFYFQQVWVWGALYAGSTFVVHPVWNGILRTANWIGFHLSLVVASYRGQNWRQDWSLFGWLALSFGAVIMGWRFFPRYYLQVLPALVILASYGMARSKRLRYVAMALLLIPLVRFGPRYLMLAAHPHAPWSDVAMDRDSRAAADFVLKLARPSDTMFFWGYRPEIWIYTGLPSATRYLDCQALTGVPADRHLTQSLPVALKGTRDARLEVSHSQPEFVLDGLTPFNPQLSMANYPELNAWMRSYELIGRTASTLIYRKRAP